mmetsp:Transcript_100768/g.245049  ORF Transcript_100768/g.245049 Transcript_100768/m.245049 type:complete len:491 (-) Transcript_100768:102-1574(-)
MGTVQWLGRVGTLKTERPMPASHEGLVDQIVHEVVRPLSPVLPLQGFAAGLEPGDGVVALAVERLPTVKDAVVVQEHHVALLHHDGDDVLLADLVHMAHILGTDAAKVAEVDISHADLRYRARPAVTEVAAVVVHVAEPDRLSCHRVPVDRGLGMLDGLQAPRVGGVGAVDHLQVHVELGCHHLQDHVLQRVLDAAFDKLRKHVDEIQVQVADRDPDFALVQAPQDVLVHVIDDLGPVSYDELAAPLRCRLEAHEGTVGGSLDKCGLIVEPDKVLCQRWLVHGLVDGILLVHHLTEARGVDRVQTWVQLQGLVHAAEAGGILHHVEVPEDDGAVPLQLLHDRAALLGEVLRLHAALQLRPQLQRIDDQRRRLRDLRQGLQVDAVSLPDRGRAVGQRRPKVRPPTCLHGRRGVHRRGLESLAAAARLTPPLRPRGGGCGHRPSHKARGSRCGAGAHPAGRRRRGCRTRESGGRCRGGAPGEGMGACAEGHD